LKQTEGTVTNHFSIVPLTNGNSMISMLEQLGCLYGSGLLPLARDHFTPTADLNQPNGYGSTNGFGQTISPEHIPATDAPIIETILNDPPLETIGALTAAARFRAYAD
jgi:hypothetical protein